MRRTKRDKLINELHFAAEIEEESFMYDKRFSDAPLFRQAEAQIESDGDTIKKSGHEKGVLTRKIKYLELILEKRVKSQYEITP